MKRLIWLGIALDCTIVLIACILTIFPQSGSKSIVHAATLSSPDFALPVLSLSTSSRVFPSSAASSTSYSTPPTKNYLRVVLTQIAHCESEDNPYAENPTSSAKGLLQILDSTWQDFGCTGNVFNADDNMRCGLKIAQQSGFQAWNASKVCWNKRINLSSQ